VEDVPRDISWVPLEEIRHENLVLVVLIGRGKDISSLKGLGEISEDVIDIENSLGGIGRASDICGLLSK